MTLPHNQIISVITSSVVPMVKLLTSKLDLVIQVSLILLHGSTEPTGLRTLRLS